MSIKTIWLNKEKVVEINKLLKDEELTVHEGFAGNQSLNKQDQAIIENYVASALGHDMSAVNGDIGHQNCTCGAEWEFWHSQYGFERRPINTLAENHII